jgi:hypothetical protein
VPEIASGQVWKVADGAWLSVDDVHGDHVTGSVRRVPSESPSEWSGRLSDFERFALA